MVISLLLENWMSDDTVLICQVVGYSALVSRISVWRSGSVLQDSLVQGLKTPKDIWMCKIF